MTTATKATTDNGVTGAVDAGLPVTPGRTPWERLREPFEAKQIGKLPRGTVPNAEWKTLPKARCAICKGWHPATKTIHLDFVGHADVTDRLLTVDPEWNWEPMATTPEGLPVFTRNQQGAAVGLWIRLSVAGVTRLGYGSVEAGSFDAEKQLIGDALRNAALRFGVALDLWRKETDGATEHTTTDTAPPAASTSTPAPQSDAPQAAPATTNPSRVQLLADVMALPGDARWTILKGFDYHGEDINKWIGMLDDDKAGKLADAIASPA